jgi:hypothetical protein
MNHRAHWTCQPIRKRGLCPTGKIPRKTRGANASAGRSLCTSRSTSWMEYTANRPFLQWASSHHSATRNPNDRATLRTGRERERASGSCAGSGALQCRRQIGIADPSNVFLEGFVKPSGGKTKRRVLALSEVSMPLVARPDEHVVRHRIPRIVNAREEQQECRRSNAQECLAQTEASDTGNHSQD